MWVNLADDTIWINVDNTDGAAVWKQVDGTGPAGITLWRTTPATATSLAPAFGTYLVDAVTVTSGNSLDLQAPATDDCTTGHDCSRAVLVTASGVDITSFDFSD